MTWRFYLIMYQNVYENSFLPISKKKPFFNYFLAKQYSIIDNVSEVPSVLRPKTDKSFQISLLLKRMSKKLYKI